MTSVQVPDFIDYPKPIVVSEEQQLFQKLYVYFIERYNFNEGYNLYVGFRKNNILIRIADFQSNIIDLHEPDDQVKDILKISETLSSIMKTIAINDASFYFPKGDLCLVDMMVSANKFIGPGMLFDLFHKVLPTQNKLDVQVIDDEMIDQYKGNIVKPSRYRHIVYQQKAIPLYGILE